jgi:hypothetical protein
MSGKRKPIDPESPTQIIEQRVAWVVEMIEIIKCADKSRKPSGAIVLNPDHLLNRQIAAMNEYFKTGRQPEFGREV